MSRTTRRLLLYVPAGLAAGVLLYFHHFYTPPQDLETRLESFFQAARAKKNDEARAIIKVLGEDFPRAVKVPLAEGFLNEIVNDLEAARGSYQRALLLASADDQRRDIRLSIADLDRRLGRQEAALAECEAIERELGVSLRSRHVRILLHLDAGDSGSALSEARRLAEEEPGNPIASRLCRQLERLVAEKATSPGPGVGGKEYEPQQK